MKGACFCGAVRYELSSGVGDVYYCHCRDCQVTSGSAFRVLGIVDRAALRVLAGKPASYRHRTDSGSSMEREFCSRCGTPLFLKSTRFPEIVMLSVGSLQNAEGIRPSFEIWTRCKAPWSEISEELHSYPRGALDGGT